MNRERRHVHRVAWSHLTFLQWAILRTNLEQHLPAVHVDRLVLPVVVLKAQRVSGVDVQHLPHIAIGFGPVELVTPRLLDPGHVHLVPTSWRPSSPRDDADEPGPPPRPGCFMEADPPSRPKWSTRTRSISSTVPSVITRAAIRAISPALVSETTRLAISSAPGVMLNSVSPQPISSRSSNGSDAISPQTATGMPCRTAPRRT